jgi:hypothetical protein
VKVKKFRLAKAVVLASAVALVIAALVFTLASVVTGPTKTPKFLLTSGTGFTITSAVYPSPACSGTPALLYPGITRCAVFSVHNSLTVPITVLTITTALDGSYPAPPAICAGSNLTLPNFSGSFTVAGGGSANSPGVPIALNDSGTNQDACENLTYHFVFSGTAQYTDATTTVLASSTNPSVSGHSVTFTATVTANNASSDPSLPSRDRDLLLVPVGVVRLDHFARDRDHRGRWAGHVLHLQPPGRHHLRRGRLRGGLQSHLVQRWPAPPTRRHPGDGRLLAVQVHR